MTEPYSPAPVGDSNPPPHEPRRALGTGILHFGPGAFHRAHQADYVDRVLAEDPRWGIAAVSLRSHDTIAALERQRGRYTLTILGEETRYRTIRAHSRFFRPGQGAEVRHVLAGGEVKVVTSTVTEKGYCLRGDGSLGFQHPDIVRDLNAPDQPVSIVGWLSLGLRDRRDAGLPPFTPFCCDNMAANGTKLRQAVIDYSQRVDPELARWISGEVRFPDTMVDSITPAADDALRTTVKDATGFDDAIPVRREAYSAWVIEDVLPAGGPDLEAAGAVLAADVGAWEQAKLRILNGAHSTLAYLGLLAGHETVADAMRDAALAAFVERLVREDIVPSLAPSPLDLGAYAAEVLQRFRNPAISHKLSQIAGDGSQKLPYRLLDTVSVAMQAGRPLERLAVPIGGWMLFIERQARAGAEIVDPLAQELTAAGLSGPLVEALLALRQVFPSHIAANTGFRSAVENAVASMRHGGPQAAFASAGV